MSEPRTWTDEHGREWLESDGHRWKLYHLKPQGFACDVCGEQVEPSAVFTLRKDERRDSGDWEAWELGIPRFGHRACLLAARDREAARTSGTEEESR